MAAVITRTEILAYLRHTIRGPLVLRLFANDVDPHRRQALSDFTEASFPGYAPATLSDTAWVDTGADPITLSHPKQTFTLTTDLATPVKIYGHYLTRGEVVVWAERGTDDHGKPRPLSIAHSRIEVTPTFIERR